jgi:antirestriction protein ArdC
MSIYQRITNTIIEHLENGTIPWRRPWKSSLPKNLVSGKTYRGINLLVLGLACRSSAYWATFRQINKLGGAVRKGERGTQVVYTNFFEVTDEETGKEKKVPFLKSYTVFNLDQTTGIEPPEEELGATPITPIDSCALIVGKMADKPTIDFDGGGRAFYVPSVDAIHLPMTACFESAESYYSTLFHELVHSTGHSSRLAREGVTERTGFGSEDYSHEELIAEIGSAFLCGKAGIEARTVENSASYIAGWLKSLRDDVKLVVIAAAQAQKAVDYICQSQ